MRPIPTSSVLLLLSTLAAGGAAAAEPGASPAAGAAPAAAPPVIDPNIDRAFIQPTAMTQPAGSVTYNNYELLLHGVTYAVNDSVQATLTMLPPIVSGIPFLAAAAFKGRVSPTARVHLALQGSLTLLHDTSHSVDTSTNRTLYTFGAGAYATLCLSDDCASLFNASVNYQYLSDDSASAHLLIYGGSLLARVATHAKLVLELTSGTARDENSSFKNLPGFFLSYGVRLLGTSLAADLGFIRPVDTSGGSNSDIILGLPFASVSYRWN